MIVLPILLLSNNSYLYILTYYQVADLAYQCGNLLTWVSDQGSDAVAEAIWKNKMRVKAFEKFDKLDADEVRKLVDRDWRIMGDVKRRVIFCLILVNFREISSCANPSSASRKKQDS